MRKRPEGELAPGGCPSGALFDELRFNIFELMFKQTVVQGRLLFRLGEEVDLRVLDVLDPSDYTLVGACFPGVEFDTPMDVLQCLIERPWIFGDLPRSLRKGDIIQMRMWPKGEESLVVIHFVVVGYQLDPHWPLYKSGALMQRVRSVSSEFALLPVSVDVDLWDRDQGSDVPV